LMACVASIATSIAIVQRIRRTSCRCDSRPVSPSPACDHALVRADVIGDCACATRSRRRAALQLSEVQLVVLATFSESPHCSIA
jgi:hypothetical protein